MSSVALKDYLTTDIATQLASISSPDTADVYAGQGDRIHSGSFDVQVKYAGETPVNRESKQIRHNFDLRLKILSANEDTAENELNSVLENACNLLFEAYDGAESTFNSNVAGVAVERVRAYRMPGIKMDSQRGAVLRTATVKLEVDEWR